MLVLLVLSCLLFEVYGQNELRPNTGRWRDAAVNCTLASPNIIFSETGNTVDIGDIELDEGQKAWVGYAMKYEIFQYIGCVYVDDINEQDSYTLIPTGLEPGQCSFACKNSTIFGLRTKTAELGCFCFETNIGDIQDTRKGCDKKCENDHFLCGNNDAVSLYTKADISQDKAVDEKCLSYKKSGKSYDYSWASCREKYFALCFNANDVSIQGKTKTHWWNAPDDCFHEDSYPMDNRSIPSIHRGKNGYWLAYINTLTITDIKGTIGSSTQKYGYVERRDNTNHLRFTTQSSVTRTSLCQTEFSSSTTAVSTTISQSKSNPVTSPIGYGSSITTSAPQSSLTQSTSTQSAILSPTPTSSTTTVATTISQNMQTPMTSNVRPGSSISQTSAPQSTSTQSDVAVYVGIVVASIFGVAVMAVVLFLCRKRQIRTLKERDRIISLQNNITYTDIDNDSSYANISMDENACEKLELPNTSNNPKKFEDNSAGIYHIAQDTDDDSQTNQMGENTYFVLEKMNGLPTDPLNKQPTDYTAEPIKEFVDRDTNVYNKANNNMDFDDYDHIGNRARQQHQENGNYDTTFGQTSNNTLYDTTRGTNSGSCVADENYATIALNI